MKTPSSAPTRSASEIRTVRIWDLPTRLFHWLLALAIVGSIVSIKTGHTDWHFRFGYVILTLLLFRLIWGFVGPRYARFSSFPPRLAQAWSSLRGTTEARAGHSPLGALSVYALLAACAFQALSGLFANDGILWDGPLRTWVSGSTSDAITGLHLANRFVIIGLIMLHLAAIAWYRVVRRSNLVAPMLTGDSAHVPPGTEPAEDSQAIRVRALGVFAGCAFVVMWLVR
jgi:cytochrome b